MVSSPGIHCVNMVEMTTDAQHFTNVVEKAVAGHEKNSVLKEVPLLVKCCQTV